MEQIDGLVDDEGASDDAPEGDPTPVEQPGPAAAQEARFAAMEADITRLKSAEVAEGSRLGRKVAELQSKIDSLPQAPATQSDPRLDALEALVTAQADLMVNATDVPDAIKATLRQHLTGLDRARTDKQRQAEIDAISETVLSRLPKPQTAVEPDGPVETEWVNATNEIVEEAVGLGMDEAAARASIPWQQIRRDSGENPQRAIRLALKWLNDNQNTDPTPTRVAARAAAAGGGSPAREGAATSIERDRERLRTQGLPIGDPARQRLADSFGLDLPA